MTATETTTTTTVDGPSVKTLAMSYNRGLDRDKDGIGCEKA